MKKILLLSAVIALIVMSSASADAHLRGRFGGGVWIGPGWGWWGPPAYTYSWSPPVVIERYPESIPVQREEPAYWYFCPDAKNYYPYVKQCPTGWLKVVPPPPPLEEKE